MNTYSVIIMDTKIDDLEFRSTLNVAFISLQIC